MRQMQIIGATDGRLRLSCEVCGAHAMEPRSRIGQSARCQVCGEYREVRERRLRDFGHLPERRAMAR